VGHDSFGGAPPLRATETVRHCIPVAARVFLVAVCFAGWRPRFLMTMPFAGLRADLYSWLKLEPVLAGVFENTVNGMWQGASRKNIVQVSREVMTGYLRPTNFSNSASVRIDTPSSLALSYFEPGSVPTTT
jgi:hypothetical protein